MKRRREQRKAPLTNLSGPDCTSLKDAFARCSFRSIISTKWPPRITRSFAAIDAEVFPMSEDLLADLLDALTRGEAILLMTNDRGVRDRGKAGLIALAGVEGRAA
jgi:hypothetical protein